MNKSLSPSWVFSQPCSFIAALTKTPPQGKWPELDLPKFLLLGRSNVGKSSLINALFNRKSLAYSSKTPGRTREIVLFRLEVPQLPSTEHATALTLIDLPGYGYAKISKEAQQHWQDELGIFLTTLTPPCLMLLLVDARHGIKPSDLKMVEFLSYYGLTPQLVLTKADKLGTKAQTEIIATTTSQATKLGLPAPILVSSVSKANLDTLRQTIIDKCIVAPVK